MGLFGRMFGSSDDGNVSRRMREVRDNYTRAIRYLDALPGSGMTRQQFAEVNRIAGNAIPPDKFEEMWRSAETMTLWEKRDGTEFLRNTIQDSFKAGIRNAESVM
jgi:hypothetical protein